MWTVRFSCVAALASILAVAPAIAQVSNVEPYYVTIAQNDAPLRCGDSAVHYPVATLKAGTVLRVDGESAQWVRVAYPAGTRAFLKADEATSDGKFARLLKPSKLYAANASVGARGSFYPLLTQEIEPGTQLPVQDVVKADDGKPTHYAVTAPAAARGFVAKDAIRKSTPTEIEAARKDQPQTPPGPAAPSHPPAPTQPSKTEPKPATRSPVISASPGGPAPVEPSGQPEPTTVTVPGQPNPAAPSPAPAPVVEPPKPSPTEAMIAMFDQVRAQPMMEAEIDQAIAEIEKHMGTLTDSAVDQAASKTLTRCVTTLKLKKEVRDAYKENEAANALLKSREGDVGKQVAEMERQRAYTVIGRLVASTVYDGQRLPLMYRIQSPEPTLARTLGYLLPDPKMDLSGKVGQVVGIVGEARFDEGLKANIYSPRKVEVVSLAPLSAAPPAAPASTGAPLPPAPANPEAKPAQQAAPGTPMQEMKPVTPGSEPEKP